MVGIMSCEHVCIQHDECILAQISYLIHVSLTWKREDCENLIVEAAGDVITVTFVEERSYLCDILVWQ